MAKIAEGYLPPFVGTRDKITIYLMNGEYIVRSKSSLTGKRVKRDPVFARTMEYAGWLKKASRIASVVYRQMPEEREYKQYRELVGKAMGLLKYGWGVDEVLGVLVLVYLPEELFEEKSEGVLEGVSEELSGELFEEKSEGQVRNGYNGDSHGNDGGDGNVENIDNVIVKSAGEWLVGRYNGKVNTLYKSFAKDSVFYKRKIRRVREPQELMIYVPGFSVTVGGP